MLINRSLLLVAAVALTSAPACLKRHLGAADASTDGADVDAGLDPGPPGRGDDASVVDASVIDAGIDLGPSISIAITSPTATTTYTNSSVNFAIAVTGQSPTTSVDLILSDDTILTSISTPFHYTWDTTTEAEGTYKVAARATIAGKLVTSSSITIVVDRTAPTVTSQSPMPGSNNVAAADPVSITFSEPLAPASVTAGAIALNAGAIQLGTTSSLNTDGTTIMVAVTVSPALSLPANITATVGTSITDRAGNPVAAPDDWNWTLPLWVDLGSFLGGFPSLALGPKDQPFLSTTDEQVVGSFVYTLHVGRLAADKTWVEMLSPSAATVDDRSALAIDATGAPLVAWSQGHIHLARWLGGTTTPWDVSYGTVDDLPTFSARYPSVAIDASNVPTIAWAYPNGHDDLDYAARWTPSTLSWQHLFTGTNVPIGRGTPSLRLDAVGSPLIIAFASNTGSVNRFVSPTWEQLDTTSATTYAPDAVVTDLRADPANRPTIVAPSASASKIRVTSFSGAAWLDLGPSITTGAGVTDARLVFDASSPVVLWSEAGQKLRLARLTQNAWNYAAGTISSASGGAATITSPTLAVDSKGRAVVAWSETTNGQRLTFIRKSNR
jgi:hypothetical protein